VEKKDAEVAAAKEKFEEAARKLQERQDALLQFDQEIGELSRQRAEYEQLATDASIDRKKKEHECAPCPQSQHHPRKEPPFSPLPFCLCTEKPSRMTSASSQCIIGNGPECPN
jgi:hypothetical protein